MVWSHSLPADARYLPSDENAMQWIAPWKEKTWRWSVYTEACSKIVTASQWLRWTFCKLVWNLLSSESCSWKPVNHCNRSDTLPFIDLYYYKSPTSSTLPCLEHAHTHTHTSRSLSQCWVYLFLLFEKTFWKLVKKHNSQWIWPTADFVSGICWPIVVKYQKWLVNMNQFVNNSGPACQAMLTLKHWSVW